MDTTAPTAENTSGQGYTAEVPEGAKGWTWAGFVPYGVFCYAMKARGLGYLGILLCLFYGAGPLVANLLSMVPKSKIDLGAWDPVLRAMIFIYLFYALYIGSVGRRVAWQRRKFASVEQFKSTMRVWEITGVIFIIIGILHFIWAFNAFVWPLIESYL